MYERRWAVGLILVVLFALVSNLPAGDGYIAIKKVAVSSVPDALALAPLQSLCVDRKGNLFCVDSKNGRILKFSPDLKYITHFGRPGKGPGDFGKWNLNKNRLSLDENGNVYIRDSFPLRLVVFDNNGKHIKDIQLQRRFSGKFFSKGHTSMSGIKVVSSGLFIAKMRCNNASVAGIEDEMMVFRVSPEKGLEVIERIPTGEKIFRFSYKRSFMMGFYDRYFGANLAFDTDNNIVVMAYSKKYLVRAYSKNMEKILEIKDDSRTFLNFKESEFPILREKFKKFGARRASRLDKLIEHMETRKNTIANVKISMGRIFVFPVRGDISVDDKYPVVIYDLKGKILKEGYFKQDPVCVWKNYVYFIETDEDDNPFIHKYRLEDF